MRRAALVTAALALALPATGGAHSRHRAHRVDEQVRQPARSVPHVPVTQPKPPASKPPAPRPLGHVQAVAREFSITLSRTTLAAGAASIELDNLGQDPHDLRVERVDAPSIGVSFDLARPGNVSSRKLQLSPGTWKLYCTLPGHAALGMSATLTVTP